MRERMIPMGTIFRDCRHFARELLRNSTIPQNGMLFLATEFRMFFGGVFQNGTGARITPSICPMRE